MTPTPMPDEAFEQGRLLEAFRQSMSLLAGGVVIVTTEIEGRPWGLTITACCSVSATPPTILISLASGTASAKAIAQRQEYGVCLLSTQSVEMAKYAAAPGQPKFLDVMKGGQVPGAGGTPCVSGSLAHLDCAVIEQHLVQDHVIFLGRVRNVAFPMSGTPLVYASRQYQRLVPAMTAVHDSSESHALVYSAW